MCLSCLEGEGRRAEKEKSGEREEGGGRSEGAGDDREGDDLDTEDTAKWWWLTSSFIIIADLLKKHSFWLTWGIFLFLGEDSLPDCAK